MDPVLSRYQRDVNCLSDADRSTRSRSLVRLSDALVGRRADDAFDAPGERSRFLSESLLQPLLARLADPVEKCREVALTLVTKLIEDDLSAAQPGFSLAPQLLDAATAELVRYADLRLGEVPFPETSEELRLAWTELFCLLLSHTGCQPALSRELSKVVKVLCKAISDSFPENKTQCAKCTVKLCERFPESIHLHLEVLIVAITANMGHQHSKVRSASLEAVKQLVLAGAATSSNFEELMRDRIVPVLRGLNYDRSSSVRKQGLYLASELLLSMPKSQSYHKDLLPILLFALADPAKQLQEESLAIIEKVGITLLEGSSVAEGSGEPPAPPTQSEASGSAWSAHLPEPFQARPSYGARQLVVQTMPSALPVVLREAMDWTAQERFRAVALARSILVFAEENIAPFVKDVLNMLYVTCLDDELVIREASMDCARLMGQFATPEKLLKEVAATFSGMNPNRPEETVSARIGGLAVLSAAVLGLPSTPQLVEHLCTCVGIVISSSLCESESEEVQRYVLQIIQGILDRFLTEKGSRAGDLVLDNVTVCKLLYVLLILVTSEEKEGDFLSETENSIALLAGCAGYLQPHGAPDTKALIVACASTLLHASVTNNLNTLESAAESDITDDLVAACTSWNKFDGRRRVFDQVSRRAGAEGLERAGCTLLVVRVLCATSSVELDADLRLCMLSLLESLVSSHAAAMEQDSRSPLDQHLATIVSDVLMPNLVWRAGRVANTIRKVSVFCFSRFVGVSEAQAIWFEREFDTISPPLKACLDDMEPDTRRFACQAFKQIFSLFARHEKMLEPLQVSNLYHDIIKRLDDADDTVRIVACGALEEMVRVAPASILTGTVVEYITDMSFIHLDDPKTEVQQAVFDLLSQIIRSGTDAETVFTKASNQRGQHRSPQWCDRLIALKGN